jgi:hypothetical protein
VHFCQHPLIQFLHTLSQCVSPYWLLFTHRLVPLLHLLVHFISNVYTVFEHAYLSPENQHHAAILVRIEMMRFFQRSHDFRTLQWRMGQILLHSIPYSILYNLSWSRFFYLRTSTTCLRGVRLQGFFIGHRRPILSSHDLNPRSPLPSPTVTLPSDGRVGGGRSRLPCT